MKNPKFGKRYRASMIAFASGCVLIALGIYFDRDVQAIGIGYAAVCASTIGAMIYGDTKRKSE